MKKNSCTPIKPKKYSCYGLKKIHTRNLLTKKNSGGSKIPLPPHNFSNGPSLTEHHTNHKSQIGHALHSTFVDFVALGDLT